jgi:hypothetical protein
MGVQTTRGLLLPLTHVSTDAAGTTHMVTVPFDTALQLTIVSAHASIANETTGANRRHRVGDSLHGSERGKYYSPDIQRNGSEIKVKGESSIRLRS